MQCQGCGAVLFCQNPGAAGLSGTFVRRPGITWLRGRGAFSAGSFASAPRHAKPGAAMIARLAGAPGSITPVNASKLSKKSLARDAAGSPGTPQTGSLKDESSRQPRKGDADMMNPGTSAVFLPCSDIRSAEHFYHDILGFPIAERQAENLLVFDTGYGYWGFCQYPDGRKPLSGPHGVCLSVNLESEQAVLDAYEEYKCHCPVHREPAWHPQFPVFSFFLLDPDGYLVEFQKTNE